MAGSQAKKVSTPSKATSAVRKQSTNSTKRNKSILNFFQKTENPHGAISRQSRMTQFVISSRSPGGSQGTLRRNSSKNDIAGGLFLEDKKGLAGIDRAKTNPATNGRARSRTPENIWGEVDDFLGPDDAPYDKQALSVKCRKVDTTIQNKESGDHPISTQPSLPAKKMISGPFIDESDSEGELDAYRESQGISHPLEDAQKGDQRPLDDNSMIRPVEVSQPSLVRDATSFANDENADFDDIEEDEFVGEDFRDQPWEDEEQDYETYHDFDATNDLHDPPDLSTTTSEAPCTCPVCEMLLTACTPNVSLIFSMSSFDCIR